MRQAGEPLWQRSDDLGTTGRNLAQELKHMFSMLDCPIEIKSKPTKKGSLDQIVFEVQARSQQMSAQEIRRAAHGFLEEKTKGSKFQVHLICWKGV